MRGRYGSNEWKINLFKAGSIILAAAVVLVAAYGAYSYIQKVMPDDEKLQEPAGDEGQITSASADNGTAAGTLTDPGAAGDDAAGAGDDDAAGAAGGDAGAAPGSAAENNNADAENDAADMGLTEDADAETQMQQTAAINEAFHIDARAAEDYGAVLDPDLYAYYDSGISDFAFYYPAELYHAVTYSEEPIEKDYGMNMQTIEFQASKGSALTFTLYRRMDYLSMEQMTNHVYEQETASMQDASKLVLSVEEDYGRVIVTGYNEERDRLIYDMVKIERSYVLQMKLIFPQYTGAEDQLQKGYVTECVYRMCPFSGSSKSPRSYQNFKKGS